FPSPLLAVWDGEPPPAAVVSAPAAGCLFSRPLAHVNTTFTVQNKGFPAYSRLNARSGDHKG
ncbi:MAG: hypothetical protein ACHP79_10790, partial [Terriglobales bacterium]